MSHGKVAPPESLAMQFVRWVSGSGPQNDQDPEEDLTKIENYATEVHRLCDRFIAEDVSQFLHAYPLTGLVATVALGFFGLMNILSFSPTNILTGVFLLTLSFCLAKGIWRMGILQHLSDVQQAIWQLMQYRSQTTEEATDSAPAKPEENKQA